MSDPARPFAIIVDLDETLCSLFDVPIRSGVELLRRVDRLKLQIHYVTARTEKSRRGTERFIEAHDLPGGDTVHYSPTIVSSRQHKLECHLRLARECRVLASIGDSFEEAEASEAAGVPFVLVDVNRPESAWVELAALLEAAGVMVDDDRKRG